MAYLLGYKENNTAELYKYLLIFFLMRRALAKDICWEKRSSSTIRQYSNPALDYNYTVKKVSGDGKPINFYSVVREVGQESHPVGYTDLLYTTSGAYRAYYKSKLCL